MVLGSCDCLILALASTVVATWLQLIFGLGLLILLLNSLMNGSQFRLMLLLLMLLLMLIL